MVSTGACDARPAQRYLGADMNAEVKKALAKASGAVEVRVAGLGSEMTLEFSPSRLTVIIDRSGRVVDIWCG